MRAAAAILASSIAIAGCAPSAMLDEINQPPEFSPIGEGLRPAFEQPVPLAVFPAKTHANPHSLYAPGALSLYQDARADSVGDILTVEISIDDEARLDSRSDRLREAETDLDISFGFPNILNLFRITGGGSSSTSSESSAAGEGVIDRSEQLELEMAAIVTSVLPNGNLVISGSQEVRVNAEMRVLTIAGIVRPRDIEPDNTIPYEKIAEARLAYGGRGRITEIQQPPWGQQIYDVVVPF